MGDEDWRCATCGEAYVIKPLARDCERRHRERAAMDRPMETEGDQ